MNDPLITIAIPFYNNEATILDAVKSVFLQTYKNWELILLNDGSTDKSLTIVQEIKDSRIKIVSDGTNRGLVYRLNQIPSLANGKFLARMDSDDMMHPDRLQKQVAMLLSDSSIDLVDTGAYSIDEHDNPVGIRGLEPINYESKQVLKKAMLLHPSIMGKIEWFKTNPYNPEYIRAEDYELWCRTHLFSNFKRIQEPLYIYREGRVNIKNYIKSMETVKKIFKVYGGQIFAKNELRKEIFKTYLKIASYKLFGAFNMQHLLSKRRNTPLTTAQTMDVSKIITQIKAVNL